MNIKLVDSHCHLDLIAQANPQEDIALVIQRALDNGVKHILNVCVSISDFEKVLAFAEAYSFISASVGLHPNEREENITVEALTRLAKHPKVIAIGETGLDYYRSEGDLNWQRERFSAHIQVAKLIKKPLIVHTRAAKEDTITILQRDKANEVGGIMHCFTEDWPTAKAALDLGFYISFSGILTFKNATTIQEVARKIPADRLLIETDAPYLAPVPHRSKLNEPAFVYHTAEYLAKLRGVSMTEIAEVTTHNFYTLFPGTAHV